MRLRERSQMLLGSDLQPERVARFSLPNVLKRSDTLTMCEERLQLDLRAGSSQRFYSVYRPWLSRSCFIGWAQISGKEGLLGGAFSTCC
jgi:hypothetical protein